MKILRNGFAFKICSSGRSSIGRDRSLVRVWLHILSHMCGFESCRPAFTGAAQQIEQRTASAQIRVQVLQLVRCLGFMPGTEIVDISIKLFDCILSADE